MLAYIIQPGAIVTLRGERKTDEFQVVGFREDGFVQLVPNDGRPHNAPSFVASPHDIQPIALSNWRGAGIDVSHIIDSEED